MKALALAGSICVFAIAYFAWDDWRTSPDRVEQAMLGRTNAFLSAAEVADKDTISRLTISESESRALIDSAPAQAAGTIVVDVNTNATENAKSIWDEQLLKELSRHAKRAKSYSVDLNKDTPSIALNFQCGTQDPGCLEHAYFFFSPGGEKIVSYISFWNDQEWKRLWDSNYKVGLVTKPCDARCRQ